MTLSTALLLAPLAALAAAESSALYQSDFENTRYGRIPDGWRDLVSVLPSHNWAVDGNGFLRGTDAQTIHRSARV